MKKLRYKTLTKKAIETLLNEFFTLEKEKDEQLMEQYAKAMTLPYNRQGRTMTTCFRPNNYYFI